MNTEGLPFSMCKKSEGRGNILSQCFFQPQYSFKIRFREEKPEPLCLPYFFCCCGRSNFRGKEFGSAHSSRVQSIAPWQGGLGGRLKQLASGYLQSGRKALNTCIQFTPFYPGQDLSPWNVVAHNELVFVMNIGFRHVKTA